MRHTRTRSHIASRCRCGAQTLTDFVLDSACLSAEQTLLDQRLFMVTSRQYQDFLDLLEQPEQVNEGLQDLFSRKAPWDV
ncbi:DUF1778 domain-containing protein [Acidithiobacillus ferrivorans]|uniref:type II toxin-antitoxin system TacA family antitoxin n=1 Tax=Acidithiobacillus ferrivorans TaxID=160808 RepID=UPI0029BFDB54|nr:DUF1778 domain-containing protein [Acidithiobacillus ferrivorans]